MEMFERFTKTEKKSARQMTKTFGAAGLEAKALSLNATIPTGPSSLCVFSLAVRAPTDRFALPTTSGLMVSLVRLTF